jgi:hypothetical protein
MTPVDSGPEGDARNDAANFISLVIRCQGFLNDCDAVAAWKRGVEKAGSSTGK